MPDAINHLPRYRSVGLTTWAATAALLWSIGLAGCGSTPAAPSTAAKPAAPASAIDRPMMLSMPVWAPTSMGSPKAEDKASAAYKLDGCKTIDGWEIAIGTCTGNGTFSGVGAAAHMGLVYIGRLSNGLPDGAGSLCLKAGSRWEAQRMGELTCNSQYWSCNAQFKAGRLEGDTLQCRQPGVRGEPDVLLQMRSASGFRIDDAQTRVKSDGFNGPSSTISADLAEVDIRNQVKWGLVHPSYQAPSSRATGSVRQLQLSRFNHKLTRFDGTLTVTNKSDRHTKNPGEIVVKGVLDAEWHERFIFRVADYRWEPGAPVPREALLHVQQDDLSYQLVFLATNMRGFNEPSNLLYYKDSAGIEFDATPTECWAKGERGGAGLSVQTTGGRTTYVLEPRCGKMTTPTGSYTGRFRGGKPM